MKTVSLLQSAKNSNFKIFTYFYTIWISLMVVSKTPYPKNLETSSDRYRESKNQILAKN